MKIERFHTFLLTNCISIDHLIKNTFEGCVAKSDINLKTTDLYNYKETNAI